jgi:uncharacterized protein involved in exopolysaccharide biosynthesis
LETNQSQQNIDQEITIDISKIIKVIAKRKWAILIVTIISTALGIFFSGTNPSRIKL